MILSFFSNYLSEHQLHLCKAFGRMEGVEFTFAALAGAGRPARGCGRARSQCDARPGFGRTFDPCGCVRGGVRSVHVVRQRGRGRA